MQDRVEQEMYIKGELYRGRDITDSHSSNCQPGKMKKTQHVDTLYFLSLLFQYAGL